MTNAETETGSAVVPLPPDSSDHVAQLPLREWGFFHCPAIPYWADADGDPDLDQVLNTVELLKQRAGQGMPAYCGLSTEYTIGGQTLPAFTFLYGEPLPKECGAAGAAPAAPTTAPTELALDDPSQFTLAWSTYQDVYKDSQDLVGPFSDTLKDKKKAEESFWRAIAHFGLPFNLLVVEKVDSDRFGDLTKEFGDAWADEEVRDLQAAGLLYAIDMSILESLESVRAPDGSVRFAPATLTLLKQDPKSKELTPVSIQVWTKGVSPRLYGSKDNAWLWALQAAKTSITVWGIWLGHVYHWHTVTAAMQMTMYNNLPAAHPLWPLLRPQSQALINFNYVLLTLLWGKISPPTPVDGYMSLLELLDRFAEKRGFFDDDPHRELKARKLDAEDFRKNKDWDAYPVVGYLLEIWNHTHEFVKVVVEEIYTSDSEVANDGDLQKWLTASGDPSKGNIKGLPDVKTRNRLEEVLTSLLYRVNVHGAAGLNPSVNPALAFVANFPPCLHSADIPEPTDQWDLLPVLPHTGTIGGMTTFFFTFAYSPPYASLIPSGGVNLDPWFSSPKCNAALVTFREEIRTFVDGYVKEWNDALARIRGAPGPIPGYATNQYGQWPTSIEI
jgi:Lipoxygenase